MARALRVPPVPPRLTGNRRDRPEHPFLASPQNVPRFQWISTVKQELPPGRGKAAIDSRRQTLPSTLRPKYLVSLKRWIFRGTQIYNCACSPRDFSRYLPDLTLLSFRGCRDPRPNPTELDDHEYEPAELHRHRHFPLRTNPCLRVFGDSSPNAPGSHVRFGW